ncbi:unnamed protein product [Rotaria socialis]|uniref:Uncharacterized protein n=1 Tax=Rotaria socialis TaxID=392032 RepID=A0A818YWS4_9BILA|nr:unnamed protein product [Rotaria socialis]CAF3647923.1 unnamed protein product [Rotaria socialis]CAF3762422.1 unnamed protein product [Rotaria socialis]CAF4554873.1 unnamed protein product [Rotaria socialis]CAF4590607.1 unnamed protein product [Rotaria socialis]
MSLESIKDKLETIEELNFKGKHISQTAIDELEHGSIWSWLRSEGKLDIVKHERNLKVLNGFSDFVNVALTATHDTIIKLKIFKNDAEELKKTGVLLENLPHMSANRHIQILEAALKRLLESKEKFEGHIQQANKQK